ncbi:hypothetical protein Moror_6797 [Moniliophthora roreri MCA 2997]|uniref:Uncharacterized protein n=2 Tax=Moniliophthora roreri TaxID=221103 RepID=V2XS48_MONRO|nr:hypothetical protein Moror_6797 [Moniliophthora roreri MCA 2997]KAI3618626.1 hypothetical protein WG66_016546 [Moniliophthora roreri]
MFTAPALLLGLSARLLLDYVSRSGAEQNFRDFFMVGLWEGVLWCTVKSHDLAIPAAIGIAAKEFIEFNFTHNSFRSIISLLGIVIGAIGTDLLSGIIDQPTDSNKRSPSKSHHHSSSGNTRSHERERERRSSRHSRSAFHGNGDMRYRPPRRTTSDITSVDSESELIGPKATMSPIEREVAALRARASLADSERRRFKEEKKWALAEGNMERAKELKWQVKRYSALMKSFHREADNKLLEASGSGSRTRLPTIEEKNDTVPGTSNGHHRSSRNDHPTVSVDISPSQLKSAIRVNVR